MGHVVFNHGLHAGPWGTKIQALADVARRAGFEAHSVDCEGVMDADERVRRLVALATPLASPRVIVGSSLGAWVAAKASTSLHPDLLFLMAPAFHVDGLPEAEPAVSAGRIVVVHGWRDETIPVENATAFARRHRAELHLVDDAHNLLASLSMLTRLFAEALEAPGKA